MEAKSIDDALIEACLANRRQAQRRLYELSLDTLTFLARRYLHNEAELQDALQESYLSIFQHLGQYDQSKASFNTWAGRITINACLKRNRAAQKSATVELAPELMDRVCPQPGPLAKLTDEELLGWIKEMPQDFYTVFNLYAVEGYQHQEISVLLNISQDLSRQRLSRARTWLKRAIVRHPESPLSTYPDWPTGILSTSLALAVYAFLNC